MDRVLVWCGMQKYMLLSPQLGGSPGQSKRRQRHRGGGPFEIILQTSVELGKKRVGRPKVLGRIVTWESNTRTLQMSNVDPSGETALV